MDGHELATHALHSGGAGVGSGFAGGHVAADEGGHIAAADPIGAGEGEWVIVSRGSSARFAIDKDAPLDLVIVGIVDHVNAGKAAIYRKNQGE